MKKFDFLTLGCKVNQYETEAMEEIFKQRGYCKSSDKDPADVYVINTCTVTNMSDRKSRQYISKAKKANPKALIVVVGCYSQVAPEDIEGIEDVDVIMGTKNRAQIVDLVELSKQTGEKINVVGDFDKREVFDDLSISNDSNMDRAYIKIQEGCNMFCTYCIIPYARGPISSRKLEDIVEEAKRLAQNGYKELILTGIHIASYGKDLGGPFLIDAIEEVSKVKGIERIRLSSIEPKIITRDFLERLSKTKVCDHFHMSLQSGSNEILKAMNRKYSKEEYKERVDLIREFYPDAGITTDIICGFPGETDKLFEETMDFVDQVKFSKIHIFPFSRRKGTPAYSYKNQVKSDVKKARCHSLSEKEKMYRLDFLKKHIGMEKTVLFEKPTKDDGKMRGYTGNYLRVCLPCQEKFVKKIKKVRILDIEGDELIGTIVD